MNVSSIKMQAYENIRRSTLELTKNMSRDELENMIVSLTVQAKRKEEERRLLNNAIFAASTETEMIRLLDLPEDSDFKERDDEFKQKLQEKGLAAAEHLREKADDLLKIAKGKGLTSAAGKQSSMKCRKPENVEEVVEYKASGEKCPVCGEAMVHAGWKTRKKMKYIPARIVLVEERYETVVCPKKCLDENEKTVIRTVKPKELDLIDKSIATESLVAGLAYNKFKLGTPLYRMEKNFHSFGQILSRQTMSNITQGSYESYLEPVYKQMVEDFRCQDLIHMDETGIKCIQLKDSHKISAMIVGVTGDREEKAMTIYRFSAGKSQQFVADTIGDEYQGTMMTDGLKAYENYPGECTKLSCMAHARRRFHDALTARDDFQKFRKLLLVKGQKLDVNDLAKTLGSEAVFDDEVLGYLRTHAGLNILLSVMVDFSRLYRVESEYKTAPLEVLGMAREELSRPFFEEMAKTIDGICKGFMEKSPAWKAARYFQERKEVLSRYLDDPRYPIDNNKAERAVKSFVIPRKNFLFCNTQKGAEAAAGYMTLIQTAEQNGLNAWKYLEYVLKRLKYYKDQSIPKEVLRELVPYSKELPDSLKKETE